jgi:hypothetical protein
LRKLGIGRLVLALVAILAICFSGKAAIAGSTGDITGTVVDAASGQPLAGAKVTAVSPSQIASATTGNDGRFAMLSLAPDTYTISIEQPGFDQTSESGIAVFADQTQRVEFKLQKALRTIGKITSRSNSDLVRPGAVSDSYSINASTQAAITGLGGGGSLNQAYSALAAVPGVYVPSGQNGWSQSAGVVIRGGTHTQVGYELDGVPVNVGINFFPGSNLSTLGQQELQVYSGSAPANAESQGLSGFVNQVIKTGTYPVTALGDVGVGTPFYHKLSFELSGASPNRNFSYYVGVLGANQSYRLVDNYNGASYTYPFGTAVGTVPCPNNGTDLNYASCYGQHFDAKGHPTFGGGTPGGLGVGPGGFLYAPPNYGNPAYQEDRENIVNLHFALPHLNGLKDDIQVLYDTGGIATWLYSSQNDLPPGLLAAAGATQYAYPSSVVYKGPVGQFLPANYAAKLQPYYFPTEEQSAIDGNGLVPLDRRDQQQNNQSILKLQYQHNISQSAYVRLYGYTLYSNFLLNGANGGSSPFGIGEPPDYKLWTHTSGLSSEFADQLGSHLIGAQASLTNSPSVRDNSGTAYTSPKTPFALAVDGNSPSSGVCYNVAGAVGTPVACEGGDVSGLSPTAVTLGQGTAPAASLAGATCGGGPCKYYVVQNGFSGTNNTVTQDAYAASIRDQWKPSERLTLDYGLKFHDYVYTGAGTGGGTRDFWFNAYNNDYCVNSQPGNAPVTKNSLGIATTAACSAANVAGKVSYVSPGLTNSPANYAFQEWEPRVGATYSASARDVLRASYGKYTQPTETGFEQYNTLQQNLPAYIGSHFYSLGFTGPGHDIPPQESFNTDFSWEHAFKNSDMSFKVSPFYRATRNELTEFFVDPATQVTSGLAVGSLRTSGVEFQFRKGSFDRDGLSALLSYTYTTARIHYNTLPNGGTILSPLNNDIKTYNAYTSFCATHASDSRCGATTAKNGGSAACFTSAGVPDPACAAGDIANPYWNAPVQNLLDPGGSYWPTDPVIAGNSLGVNSYTVPHVATLVLNYRKRNFAITPSIQFQAGQRYGSPEANAGIDPASGCLALAGASVTGDPRYPYGAAGGSPYDALTCGQNHGGVVALNAIPNVFTGQFDGIGAFVSPSQLLGSLTFSYDATKNVGFTVVMSNVFNQCFGGTQAAWTGGSNPHVCSYESGEVSRVYAPTGNVYNPGAKFEPFAQDPYFPYLGPYTMGVVNPSAPFGIYVDMHVRL